MSFKQHFATLISLLVVASMLLSACQLGAQPTAQTAATSTTAPTSTEPVSSQAAATATAVFAEPLPPQVIQVTPAPGEEQPLDAPLQLVFDQPMDSSSVQAAFTIEPAVKGDFSWPTPRVMQFKPLGDGFKRAAQYAVSLKENAKSQAGLALEAPVQFHFSTVGFLEVAAVQPISNTTEVAISTTVTVLFNRPVVPLTAIENQGSLPQPLTFVPPVRGKGEWLNTSIYLFTPDAGFEPATAYKARIAAGLKDTTGGVLAEDFTWEFTTVMPAAVASYPDTNTQYVSTQPTINVAFNQPMDHKSAEAAFELKNATTREVVQGTFEWHSEGLGQPTDSAYQPYQWKWSQGEGPAVVGVETMSFTPDKPLEFAATYRATVNQGAKGAKGTAGTEKAYSWTFETIQYPRIVSTYPADGEKRADPGGGLQVTFSSPINPDSINGNFTIQPTVAATQVYTYWWDSNTQLNISFPVEPSSDYQVTLSGDIEGRYGQKLGEASTIRWTTRAADPIVYLHAPYRVGTYDAYTQTMAYVTVRNVSKVNFDLYRMPSQDFLRANGVSSWDFWEGYTGSKQNLIRSWTLDVKPELNHSLIYGVKLGPVGAQGPTPLPPGLYYLQVRADPASVYPEAQGYGYLSPQKEALIVSRNNLSLKTTATESLVWATDLHSGAALPQLPIVVMDESGKPLGRGATDKDGVFYSDKQPAVTDTWKPVFAFVGDPDNPDQDFAATINQWSDGISPWEFNIPVEDYLQPFAAYFFTDRPIYRPGQKVYFKGILRNDDDAHYSLPARDKKIDLTIMDPQGTKVMEDSLSVSDLGTMDGSFSLGDEAALGMYSIQATYPGHPDQTFGASFQVAEYRKPEYQVTVDTDKPEYVQGDKIKVSSQATYYFGGPVANAKVHYSVLSADYAFNYQGKGWWDFTDYDYSRSRSPQTYAAGELIAEGDGTTDAEGRFTFSADADIAKYTLSQRFTLEVSVTDINNQQVSSRTEATVHKGLFYIGLRPERYVGIVDKENGVNIITVDWASQPSPDRTLTVVFSEHNWYSVRKQAEDGQYYWESSVEDIPVFTTTVKTDSQGQATTAFTPTQGGVYKVSASGLDEKENKVSSATYMWVSGNKYINWRQENNDRIDLVADQRQYKVGDTATILIPHPYQGPVQALITIERGHIYQHWVQTLKTNSEQIKIPITTDLIPDVFVSVVIVKGEDETNPLPSFKIGYVQLPIDPTEKEMTIKMTPDKAAGQHYQPGDKVTYDVQVTDSQGKPLKAELALNLVDLSVLSLTDEQGPDIVSYFWRERGLAVHTASGLTLSIDRVNLSVAPEAKGGGGGPGEEFATVRRRFPDTAYWNPSLRTDENGRATVSVELPDTLTTWRMGARGVTADTLVGKANVDVLSTKDLQVRPVAPRFFVVGDQADLSAVVQNSTDKPLDAEVSFSADGLQIAGEARQTISVPAKGNAKVDWQVTAGDVPAVKLLFGVKASGLSDAVEIPLPVYRYSTPEVVATAGEFDADGQRIEAAVLPARYDPTQGELSVHIDPSLAAGMVDGLKYLEHYPYECTEQTVSRFLPNVVSYRALKQLGVDRSDLETTLPGLVGVGLQRLYNQQHYDGGWGWWVIDKSDPYLTAYVLLGLIEADKAGFVVDKNVVKRGLNYLQGSLATSKDLQLHWQTNRQAFILYVMAEGGQGDLGRSVSLFDRRDTLDTFGKAYLAMALALLEPDKRTRVDALLSDITNAAIVSATGAHWEEAQVDYYAMNTDTRSTAIVLAALARLDPKNALGANTVRWLMVARKDGYWETTQETAWAILGLTDWMVSTGELKGAYNWQVVVNGEALGKGTVSSQNIKETTKLQIAVAKLLADQANRVVIERWAPDGQNAGTGRLYYSLYLRYYKPVEEVTALNRGVIVSRQYTLSECATSGTACKAIDTAKVGDVIQVKLTIIAPNDLHYVVVEDPFPAGAEGVDQSLKTTTVVGQAPELTRTDRRNPWGGEYGWWWFSHTELRDEKAVLFATYLPRGTYEYTYLIRASMPGEFRVIPTNAYEMYFPEVFGRSDGGVFNITQ
jgi:uncharacterized protein YfaS (alpha-2-macroglobulin family)